MSRALYSSLLIALFLISFASAATFKEASNAALDNQISGNFAEFTQFLFKTSDLSLEGAIVLFTIFIVLLFVLENIISFIPLFSGRGFSFVMAFLVSCLISISGAYSIVSQLFFDTIRTFVQGSWSLLVLALVLVGVVIAGLVLWLLSNNLHRWKAKQDAHDSGLKLGTDVGLAKIFSGLRRRD